MTPNIVVAGDVAIDWYFWAREAGSKSGNVSWKLFEGLNIISQPGGSLFLLKLINENWDKTQRLLDLTQKSLIQTIEYLDETKQQMSKTQQSLNQILESLNTNKENLNIYESLKKTQENLNKVKEDLGKTQENLNTIPENLRKIQLRLNGTKESLTKTKIILDTVSENLNKTQQNLGKETNSLEENQKNLSIAQESLDKNKKSLEESLEDIKKSMNNLKENPISIIGQPYENLNTTPLDEILHTNSKLNKFPSWESESKEQVYRVEKRLGFTTPQKDYPEPLAIEKCENGLEDFVIIHDAGNGFRFVSNKWPKALDNSYRLNGDKPVVIYQMQPPLFEGDLWEHVLKDYSDSLILILNAEDLRNFGANISRSLSWEKTALELLWEINRNQKLEPIKNLENVIVLFKVEGLIHYSGAGKDNRSKLYFDPSASEGGFWDSKKFGTMRGVSTVFVSSLASELIKNKYIDQENNVLDLERGIKVGILKSREFLKKGHGTKINENTFYAYIYGDSIEIKNEEDWIKYVSLPPFNNRSKEPDPKFWSILKEKTKSQELDLVTVAMDIVKNGWSAIEDFPAGHFGKLTTVDRAEIESFGSLKNIMQGYINSEKKTDSEKNPRPLSISVFGYPGSGKSFGITEVAKSIDQKKIEEVSFNVSQFGSRKDLINAFHKVRDISLRGKIPLVFFDEFDCAFEERPLGWLRYFLAPMQDGEFIDCGTAHPIGKSIFVFAGGIYKSFQEFCESTSSTTNTLKNPPEKCPDFISRLRGYVNILGPNRICENKIGNDKRDDAYIIRRAVQLRSLIENNALNITKEQKDSKGRCTKVANIDSSLLKTLLTIPKYKHGVRSLEAIINMSMLQGKSSWEKSSLPPKDQLELHVENVDQFFTILEEPE